MTWRCSVSALSQRINLVFDPFDGVAGARGRKTGKAAAAAAGFEEGNIRAPGRSGQAGTSCAELGKDYPADGTEDEEQEEKEEEDAQAAHVGVLVGVWFVG